MLVQAVGAIHSVVVQVGVVQSGVDGGGDNRLGDNRGLDDSLGHGGDDGLGDIGDVVVDAVVGQVVDTGGVGGVGGVQQQLGVGLSLGLTLDEVLVEEVGVVQARVAGGVHGLGNGVHGLDKGLVQVGGGLSAQVVNLGGLDGQGVVRDNSSVGVLHHTHGLGVGIAIDVHGRVGKKELGVSLWGSLG